MVHHINHIREYVISEVQLFNSSLLEYYKRKVWTHESFKELRVESFSQILFVPLHSLHETQNISRGIQNPLLLFFSPVKNHHISKQLQNPIILLFPCTKSTTSPSNYKTLYFSVFPLYKNHRLFSWSRSTNPTITQRKPLVLYNYEFNTNTDKLLFLSKI
jgi:hypothetical protein